MGRLGLALALATVWVSLVHGITYTWNASTCRTNVWNAQTPTSCWYPHGTPQLIDDVIIPSRSDVVVATSNVTGSYGSVTYSYGVSLLIPVQSLTVQVGASLTITDKVALYIAKESHVLGKLAVSAYIGALDGTGDLIVSGTLDLRYGNIQGSGKVVVQPGANMYVNSSGIRETYIMRNITAFGNITSLPNSVIHVGFWWQPVNISIYVAAGGYLNFAQGFFSKHFEGNEFTGGPYPLPVKYGSIYVEKGATALFGRQKIHLIHLINFGLVIMPYPYGGVSPVLNQLTFPWGADVYNFGVIQYYYTNAIESSSFAEVFDCTQLREYVASNNRGPLHIKVEWFAKIGPLDCGLSLSTTPLTIQNTKIRFVGEGGLIFAESLFLEGAQLEMDDGVDVVFIQEFHARDSTISIPANSEVKLMYMPKDAKEGYHNYLDKSVMSWPESQKKISFNGVKLIGSGGKGGIVDFLSELNLQENGFGVMSGEVYFQREYGASAITGPGDLIVMDGGKVSFGIESRLAGSGSVLVMNGGVAEVPQIANVTSERNIIAYKDATFSVVGDLQMAGGVSVIRK